MKNSFTINGRLTKDPVGKQTKNGKPYAFFSVACDRNYKNKVTDKYEVDYFDFIIFDQPAQYLINNGYKGREVCVSGFLKQNNYKTKKGFLKNGINLVCDNIELFGLSKSAYYEYKGVDTNNKDKDTSKNKTKVNTKVNTIDSNTKNNDSTKKVDEVKVNKEIDEENDCPFDF